MAGSSGDEIGGLDHWGGRVGLWGLCLCILDDWCSGSIAVGLEN